MILRYSWHQLSINNITKIVFVIYFIYHWFNFQCQERQIPAHKVVLSASLDYFRMMFNSDMTETRQKQIRIQVWQAFTINFKLVQIQVLGAFLWRPWNDNKICIYWRSRNMCRKRQGIAACFQLSWSKLMWVKHKHWSLEAPVCTC